MEKLRFEFVVKASSEDQKTSIICVSSITDVHKSVFIIPEQYQSVKLHDAIMKTQAFQSVKNTLQRRHDKRQVWISVTPEIKGAYIDGDGNMQFKGYLLEELTPNTQQQAPVAGISEEALSRILENFAQMKSDKSNTQALTNLKERFVIEKFTRKTSNVSQWITTFEAECTRFGIEEDTKRIEVLRLFLEESCLDWYSAMLIKHTVASEWSLWKKNFCETYADKGWSPIRYADTTCSIPLVFVLSTGSDPFGAFQKFATEMGVRDRVHSISLGQGQGPVAEKMINAAKPKGDWIFLQNCHLAASWMLSLELIVARLATDPGQLHNDFRLFLSSMPTPKFPVSVLQNAVKVTNEPPKGLKANVKRALIEMEEDFFENNPLGQDWRTMLFGICMFHAIIQERKKFGPLGWNITYEFNNSDRECAMLNLQMFCESGFVPWAALEYITSLITYGGRVTDMWDQRCLTTILKKFFSPVTLEEGYAYSESGIYYCPREDKLEAYRTYVDTLPVIESPEVFGMHDNANIAFENKETSTLINTIVDVQPRMGGGGGGDTPDQIVWRICDNTRSTVSRGIDRSTINPGLMELDDMGQLNSLTTVLIHETDRFNTLLKLIHSSLTELQKAIKGIVVMSEDFEEVFNSFLNNKVPAMWHKKGYNSLKSLGSWIHDLVLRVDFIEKWLVDGKQRSSWVSGLFFPQGLLTGSLQSYARRYRVPIDALMFDFWPSNIFLSQEDVYKENKKKNKDPEEDVYGTLELPTDGVNIHGLFIDAARWDVDNSCLVDALPGQMNPPLPVIWFQPVLQLPKPDPRYEAPLYKTSERAGTLSTTGHSTNFVLPVLLPANAPSNYWIIRGTALLTQITD